MPPKAFAKFQPHAAAIVPPSPIGSPTPVKSLAVTPPSTTLFDAEVRKRIRLGWEPEEAKIGARLQIEHDEQVSKNAKA
jgi:hypothetical protein